MMGRLLGGMVLAALLVGCAGREVRPLYPYRVICGESRGELAERVAERMRLGWRLQGGVEVVDGEELRIVDGEELRWCQALTRQ